MRLPRPLLVLPLAAAAAAAVALPVAADAGAAKRIAVPCWDAEANAWTYRVKPKVCGSYTVGTETVAFEVTKLKWKNWGTKHAIGIGHGESETYSGRLDVDATKLKRCSSTLSIYTRVYVSIPKMGDIAQVAKIPCPAK